MKIHRLFLNVIFLCSVTLASSAGSSAQAGFYLETFDGPLNPAIWNVTTGGNDWDISGGKLTITRTSSGNGGLAFVPQLSGDFDVRFDYSLSWQLTYAFGDRIQLALFTDAPSHGYVVGHTQEGTIFGVAVDPVARYVFGPAAVSSTMRVTRTGSTVLMQYLQSNNWVTLQTAADSRDMWVQLGHYFHNGYRVGSQVQIDNFSISADGFSTTVVPVPEPGLCTMFVSGLGALLWPRRRFLAIA